MKPDLVGKRFDATITNKTKANRESGKMIKHA